jgi:sister chromatid cohesion protein DCC1
VTPRLACMNLSTQGIGKSKSPQDSTRPMDAEMDDAGTQEEIEWDGGGDGAEAVLGLAGGRASVLLCYHQAYGPHGNLLLEAADDLLPDLLQGR